MYGQVTTNNERESIWTVDSRTKRFYFTAFFLLFIAGMSVAATNESLEGVSQRNSVLAILTAVLGHAGSLAIGSATISMIAAEARSVIMVLTERWLQRVREERRAEGRAEGRAQERAELRAVIRGKLDKARKAGDSSRVEAYEEVLRDLDTAESSTPNHH